MLEHVPATRELPAIETAIEPHVDASGPPQRRTDHGHRAAHGAMRTLPQSVPILPGRSIGGHVDQLDAGRGPRGVAIDPVRHRAGWAVSRGTGRESIHSRAARSSFGGPESGGTGGVGWRRVRRS